MIQTLVPLVNINIAGKWMFIPLKMVSIGIDPYPLHESEKLGFFWRDNFLQRPSFQWEQWGRHNLPSSILPIGSMYGIYTNIGGKLMVNVTIYSIHGSYGLWIRNWFYVLRGRHVQVSFEMDPAGNILHIPLSLKRIFLMQYLCGARQYPNNGCLV